MKIAILGTGAFGIAIANVLNKCDSKIVMWTKFDQEQQMLTNTRENAKLFPNVKLETNIDITTNIKDAVAGAEIIISAIPFVAVENTTKMLKEIVHAEQIICSTTKGIDERTLKVTTEIMEEKLICKTCALSGPSFAIDLVKENNISFMLGSKSAKALEKVQSLFDMPNIHIETTKDIVGIQVAGAVKNAISIGAGMLDSQKASESTRAKYLTNGLVDMGLIIKKLGGVENTVYTVAGVGDLILTCTNDESRNYTFGKYIGSGLTIDEALYKMDGKSVEGLGIIRALYKLTKKEKLELNIISELYNILYNSGDIKNICKI